ncbi:MAG: HEAT repeat domain-containing protein [Candidatus Thorarchaeota archaeon]
MSAPLKDLLRDAKVEIVVARAEKDPSVIKELIESLNSDIRSVRFNASLALGELGENAAEAVSHLVDCLDDDDWSICREASYKIIRKDRRICCRCNPKSVQITNE